MADLDQFDLYLGPHIDPAHPTDRLIGILLIAFWWKMKMRALFEVTLPVLSDLIYSSNTQLISQPMTNGHTENKRYLKSTFGVRQFLRLITNFYIR